MSETTPVTPPPSTLERVLQFPLTRFVLAMVFITIGAIAGSILRDAVATALGLEDGSGGHRTLSMLVMIPAVWLAYWVYVRAVERRPLAELSPEGALRELGLGVLVGAALFSAVIAAIALCGAYRVTGTNALLATLPIFAASVTAGVVEEIIARGVIFRIIEDGLGTWAALVISAGVFGLLHHGNPNATWISSLSIALTAGLLLGAGFVLTRRLWLVIGIHFAWNYTQGGIFGVAVSGHEVAGLLQAELDGPELIAGGAFGAEASIFAVLFCVPLAVYLLVLCHRRGRWMGPMWRRRPASEPRPPVE